MAEPFVHRMRVRYSECDAQGVVFNANYLAYVDHTLTEMWRAAFGGYQVMLDRGADIVVAEARVRYLAAARFDEVVAIETLITHMGTTSLRMAFAFRRDPDGAPLCHVDMRYVFVEAASSTKLAIPAWARDSLSAWLRPDAAEAQS
ncbi:MAG: acyl-CoA thioesterase [Solirubrobacterales bacterium]|nr:acyl-CoA thioesterase [Solirubrobacterales bacterium]